MLLKSRRFWIGCIISLILIVLFFYQVDFGEIGQALATARYIFVLPAIAVLVIVMGLKAWRWRYLLRPLKKTSLKSVFSIEVIGHMVNAILPLRIGEVARAYLLGEKESVSKAATMATVAVCRVFDGLALLFVVVVLALFLPVATWLKPVIYITTAILIGILGIFLLLASSRQRLRRVTDCLLRPFPPGWQTRLKEWIDLFISGLAAMKNPFQLVSVFLLSVVIWIGEGSMFYLIAFSFDLGQPFHILLLAATAANLALLVPSSPGGIGNFEYFCIQVLVFYAVDGNLARAYAITVHAALLIPIILLGFYFLWMENISLADLARRPASETGQSRNLQEGVNANNDG
jgi:uncharacterized protein (TIRG00374 family)